MVALLNGSINAVMTYERNATVHWPYGRFRHRKLPLDAIPPEFTKEREKVTVIVISDPYSVTRNKHITALERVIPLDIMGALGTVKHKECDERASNCWDLLAQKYMFYLALENSECTDYITEKIWRNSLKAGMVPIA